MSEESISDHNKKKDGQSVCMSRREFLKMTGAATVTLALSSFWFHPLFGQASMQMTRYPRKRIGKLSNLTQDKPLEFLYPEKDSHSICFLYKLGREAHGGIGPDKDVVAFSGFCTHQGGLMRGVYDAKYKVAGPCPLHLTTFDLTRHGMVISGHATQGLPQVVLETEGNDIFATGIMGLVYGKAANVSK